MTRRKKKLTAAGRARKAFMRATYEWVFLNGKRKRIKRRSPLIEGIPADEFIRQNAGPMWCLENGMYEELHAREQERDQLAKPEEGAQDTDEDLPF